MPFNIVKIVEKGKTLVPEIIGQAVFEDQESGEFVLSFIQSTKADFLQVYPQNTIEQKWTLDYPLLAYKSVSPDNREIIITNVANDIP